MKGKNLGTFNISMMYVAMIMGAGFASGRESWQFFGVFGNQGYVGALIAVTIFLLITFMFSYIAETKGTMEFGRMISPFDNKKIDKIIDYAVSIIYYTVLTVMTSAGGSLLYQQFGLSKPIGGIIIAFLSAYTVIGNYERMSAMFSRVVPILLVLSLLTILMVMGSGIEQSGATSGFKPGNITPNWAISSIIFAGYNGLGLVTTAGECTLGARSRKDAYLGGALGIIILGALIFMLLNAEMRDMEFTSNMDLPMLGYAARISRPLSMVYAIVLYFAIYAAGSSTLYGFSRILPQGGRRNIIIVISSLVGFLLGLTGFKVLVEYLYPIQGYITMVFFVLMMINFYKCVKMKKAGKPGDRA